MDKWIMYESNKLKNVTFYFRIILNYNEELENHSLDPPITIMLFYTLIQTFSTLPIKCMLLRHLSVFALFLYYSEGGFEYD